MDGLIRFSATGQWLRLIGDPADYENKRVFKNGFTTVSVKNRVWNFVSRLQKSVLLGESHDVSMALCTCLAGVVARWVSLLTQTGLKVEGGNLRAGEGWSRSGASDRPPLAAFRFWVAYIKARYKYGAQIGLQQLGLIRACGSPQV